MTVVTTTKNAPNQSCNSVRGNDTNPYQEIGTAMKTTAAPRIARAADNEELATSGASILVPCDEPACAYINHGHWADRRDPLFMHHYVAVTDPKFRVAIGRPSYSNTWEDSVEIWDEDMTPNEVRRFARTLTICADITDALNAERTVNA